MRPLQGVRVLDMSRVLAGPFAGRILSDLGADVVKLEPPEGDVTRVWGKMRAGLAGFYTQQNVGKRNVCIDLRAEGGPELVKRLAEHAHVLIENFRPGVMERHGLSFAELSKANPALVMLSISGFGHGGPESHRAAYAPILHAESGWLARSAAANSAPVEDLNLAVADTNASLHGAIGILAALRVAEETGSGQHIDIAMLDTFLATDEGSHLALDTANLAWGDVKTTADAYDSPTAVHRSSSVEIDARDGGTRRVPQTPYRFRGTTAETSAESGVAPGAVAPHLGEHNANVLAEWIGSAQAEVDALSGAGVLLADAHAAEARRR